MGVSTIAEPEFTIIHTDTSRPESSRLQKKGEWDYCYLNFLRDYWGSPLTDSELNNILYPDRIRKEMPHGRINSVKYLDNTTGSGKGLQQHSDLYAPSLFKIGEGGYGKSNFLYDYMNKSIIDEQSQCIEEENELSAYDDPDYRDDGFVMNWKLASEIHAELEKKRIKHFKKPSEDSEQNDSRSI